MKAEFSQHRNDLYWTLYTSEDGFVKWGGYDDDYWWNNVSKSEAARVRKGKVTGKTYTLNHETNEVTVK